MCDLAFAKFGFGVKSEGAKHRSGLGRCEASEWTRKVQSIFSHFVRRDTSHLSKAVSGIFKP